MISQIHEKQHINQQPCTIVLAIYYVAYPSTCWKHQPKHDYRFFARLNDGFTMKMHNLRRKNFLEYIKFPIF